MPARVAAILDKPIPFPVEMEIRNIRERHRQQIWIQIFRLLVISFHGLWR